VKNTRISIARQQRNIEHLQFYTTVAHHLLNSTLLFSLRKYFFNLSNLEAWFFYVRLKYLKIFFHYLKQNLYLEKVMPKYDPAEPQSSKQLTIYYNLHCVHKKAEREIKTTKK